MAQVSNRKNYKKTKKSSLSQVPLELATFVVLLSLCFASALSSIVIASDVLGNKTVSSAPMNAKETSLSSVAEIPPKEIDGYEIIEMQESDISKGNLVLINNNTAFERDVSDELSTITSHNSKAYGISSVEMLVKKDVIEPLDAMLTNFYNKTAIDTIFVSSCFRSYSEQSDLYDKEIYNVGEEEAQYWVAKPGNSEHHSGLVVDLAIMDNTGTTLQYDGTGQFSLLNKSAPEYGFIVRYPEEKKETTGIYYEPWHFRYLGLPHSKICTDLNYCYEEYIDMLRNYTVEGDHLIYNNKGIEYEIYFCEGTNVYVPENSEYTISGNNVDGFIVTVK